MQNSNCKIQNDCVREADIFKIISGGNTFILHSAFSILHSTGRSHKLQFSLQYHIVTQLASSMPYFRRTRSSLLNSGLLRSSRVTPVAMPWVELWIRPALYTAAA